MICSPNVGCSKPKLGQRLMFAEHVGLMLVHLLRRWSNIGSMYRVYWVACVPTLSRRGLMASWSRRVSWDSLDSPLLNVTPYSARSRDSSDSWWEIPPWLRVSYESLLYSLDSCDPRRRDCRDWVSEDSSLLYSTTIRYSVQTCANIKLPPSSATRIVNSVQTCTHD